MVSLALATGMYIVFIKKTSGANGSPKTMISTTTVQMQVLNIAQAERIYYVSNNTYGTLDDLASSDTFKLKDPDPSGYVYSVDASGSGFQGNRPPRGCPRRKGRELSRHFGGSNDARAAQR